MKSIKWTKHTIPFFKVYSYGFYSEGQWHELGAVMQDIETKQCFVTIGKKAEGEFKNVKESKQYIEKNIFK